MESHGHCESFELSQSPNRVCWKRTEYSRTLSAGQARDGDAAARPLRARALERGPRRRRGRAGLAPARQHVRIFEENSPKSSFGTEETHVESLLRKAKAVTFTAKRVPWLGTRKEIVTQSLFLSLSFSLSLARRRPGPNPTSTRSSPPPPVSMENSVG